MVDLGNIKARVRFSTRQNFCTLISRTAFLYWLTAKIMLGELDRKRVRLEGLIASIG